MQYRDQHGRIFVQVNQPQAATQPASAPQPRHHHHSPHVHGGVGQPQPWTPPQVWTPPQTPQRAVQQPQASGPAGAMPGNGIGGTPSMPAMLPGGLIPGPTAPPPVHVQPALAGQQPQPYPHAPAMPQPHLGVSEPVAKATCMVQTVAIAPDGQTQVHLCWNMINGRWAATSP